MKTANYENFEVLRKSVGDEGAAMILSALMEDELCSIITRLIPPDDVEGNQFFFLLVGALMERGASIEIGLLLCLMYKSGNMPYPPALEWAEHDMSFFDKLIDELFVGIAESLSKESANALMDDEEV